MRVKAHRSMQVIDELAEAEKRLALANRRADREAKNAARLRPAPRPSSLNDLELAEERALNFAKLAAAVLPLFEDTGALRWQRPLARGKRARRA
eukprot:3170593-Pyramimonas_sp.AAC.1